MADHPLRPATDQRLGRPLPHQLPNPTRAPPRAINLSRFPGVCGISRSFPRLSPTPGQVPTRYSPVRHSLKAETLKAFDLHVLGMPPAFVLSQDQTLKFIPGPSLATDTQSAPARADGPISGPLKRSQMRKRQRPAPPPAHPFPSIQSQSTIPPGLPTTPAGHSRAALIPPPPNPVNTHIDR